MTYAIEFMSNSKKMTEWTVRNPQQQLVEERELPLDPVGRKHLIKVMQDLRGFSTLQTTKVLAKKYLTCAN